jgi:hypothetical protein
MQPDVAVHRMMKGCRYGRQNLEASERHNATAPVLVSTTALNCIAR